MAELRDQGFDGELIVVGAEPREPYDRPPLSKELLSRTEPLWLADEGYGRLGELADRVLLAHQAVSLDHADGIVLEVAGPEQIHDLRADAAVVATGAHAWLPPEWLGVLQLHDAFDAERLREVMSTAEHLVVIGAGWIGAEVATVAATHGLRVTVLEAGPAPGWQALGTEVGGLLVPAYERHGIELRCGVQVVDVQPGQVDVVTADGGAEVLRSDAVLAATGVRPATGWLTGSLPLTPRGAVPVDLAGRVLGGPAHVRAVGDCTDVHSPRDGTVPGAHWDTALTAPARLAADLLGHELPEPMDPAPYVFSTQLGHELTLVGRLPSTPHEVVLRGPVAEGAWTALYVQGDRLHAGLTVDRPRDIGALRKALASPERPVVDLTAARDATTRLRRALR